MSKNRQRVSSGAPWEKDFGYCRAVRVGSQVAIAGTTAIGEDGKIVGPGDAFAQTQCCLQIIEKALMECGGDLSDVIRTRLFVVRIEDSKAVGLAHAQAFRDFRPASTLVEVSGLMDPDMLVEIEADAVLRGQP